MLQCYKKAPYTLEHKPMLDFWEILDKKQNKATHLFMRNLLLGPGDTIGCLQKKEAESFYIAIMRQGSFTTAIITDENGVIFSSGVAKRNCSCDGERPERGERIAVSRAIDNLFVEKVIDMSKLTEYEKTKPDFQVFDGTITMDADEPFEIERLGRRPLEATEPFVSQEGPQG